MARAMWNTVKVFHSTTNFSTASTEKDRNCLISYGATTTAESKHYTSLEVWAKQCGEETKSNTKSCLVIMAASVLPDVYFTSRSPLTADVCVRRKIVRVLPESDMVLNFANAVDSQKLADLWAGST
eukprot:3562438-Amphidinium_carterae.1